MFIKLHRLRSRDPEDPSAPDSVPMGIMIDQISAFEDHRIWIVGYPTTLNVKETAREIALKLRGYRRARARASRR